MAYSPKEGNVTALLGSYFSRTNYSPPADKGRYPMKSEFALIAHGDISSKGTLELAVFHMNKTFFRTQESYLSAEETQMLHIAMGYRHWLTSRFYLGASIYSSYTLDKLVVLYNDFPAGYESGTSARDITKYGMDFAVGSELWSAKRWGLVLDLRYSYAFSPKPRERADHYGAVLGLRYLIQEKTSQSKPK